MTELTKNAISDIANGIKVEKPILQVLGYKRTPGATGSERFRLSLSDGNHSSSYTMISTTLNNLIHQGDLEDHTLIQVEKYVINHLNNKRLMLIFELSIIVPGGDLGEKLGNPITLQPPPITDSTPQKQQASFSGNNGSWTVGSNGCPTPPNKLPTMGQLNPPRVPTKPEARKQRSSYDDILESPTQPAAGPSRAPAGSRGVRRSLNDAFDQTSSARPTVPIVSITQYLNRWTIRARVTNKSNVRNFSKSNHEGKVFSMDLTDDSGEIKAAAFGSLCDKFFDIIEVGNVYYISCGTAKRANKQFTSIKHDYEITFNDKTTVEPCHDDVSDVPSLKFNFVTIGRLPNMEKNSIVDVIGICKHCSDVQNLVSRTTNRDLKKRDVLLVDQSNAEINVTVWDNEAEKLEPKINDVVAFKGVKITDFGGCSLSLISSSTVQINPDIDEARNLLDWYSNEGAFQQSQSLSRTSGGSSTNWKLLEDISVVQQGTGDQPEFYTCKAAILFIKRDNTLYKACPDENCKKKLTESSNGRYRCAKCAEDYDNFKWGVILNMNIGDHTHNVWVTAFQEMAQTILGVSAQELGDCSVEDRDRFENYFVKANFKQFIFKLRAKIEYFNDERRLRTTVLSVTPVDFQTYNKKLLTDIRGLLGRT